MSITIKPHGVRADITVDSMEEARTVLRELTPSSVGVFAPATVTNNIEFTPDSEGKLPESVTVWPNPHIENSSAPVEDIDDMTSPARRIKSWTTGEEYILKTKTREGLNCRQIGDILGRTDSSVRNKLHALEAERARLNLTPIRVSK